MKLFVLDIVGNEIPTYVSPATVGDLQATTKWQTKWTSKAAQDMPNKVALRRTDADELLGLMAYAVDDTILAVEIIYVESADHSNANILHGFGGEKKYIGIAKATQRKLTSFPGTAMPPSWTSESGIRTTNDAARASRSRRTRAETSMLH